MEISELHDGLVEGLQIDGDVLRVYCRRADGKKRTIVISDVVQMQANDFRTGNIILALVQEDVTTERVQRIAIELGINSSSMQTVMSCVQLIPSYGCEIVAFSRSLHAIEIE